MVSDLICTTIDKYTLSDIYSCFLRNNAIYYTKNTCNYKYSSIFAKSLFHIQFFFLYFPDSIELFQISSLSISQFESLDSTEDLSIIRHISLSILLCSTSLPGYERRYFAVQSSLHRSLEKSFQKSRRRSSDISSLSVCSGRSYPQHSGASRS